MVWDTDFPLAELAQKLIDTRLRVERVRLAQRLQMLGERVERQGLQAPGIQDLFQTLQQATPLPVDRVDRALVPSTKKAGVWRRRYLVVQNKPGSVF